MTVGAHFKYWRCLSEGCSRRWVSGESAPRCLQCGGKKRAKLPGVTTILGALGWKTRGLMHWAHKIGTQGFEMDEVVDAEATIGSIAHMAIRAEVLGQPFDLDKLAAECQWQEEQMLRARKAINAWREWKRNTNLEMIASELPLVSSLFDYGGTLDGGAARVNGERVLLDWKSGKVYGEAVVQVAGYAGLWTENRPNEPLAGVHLVRCGKDSGSFTDHYIPIEALKPACEAFVHAFALYKLRKPVEDLL